MVYFTEHRRFEITNIEHRGVWDLTAISHLNEGQHRNTANPNVPLLTPLTYCFKIELEFGMLVFGEGGKPEDLHGEKLSEQGREPTANSTHMRRQLRK